MRWGYGLWSVGLTVKFFHFLCRSAFKQAAVTRSVSVSRAQTHRIINNCLDLNDKKAFSHICCHSISLISKRMKWGLFGCWSDAVSNITALIPPTDSVSSNVAAVGWLMVFRKSQHHNIRESTWVLLTQYDGNFSTLSLWVFVATTCRVRGNYSSESLRALHTWIWAGCPVPPGV